MLNRSAVWSQAWPIMISQAAVPVPGLVDTALIGRTEDAIALAGLAVGIAIINFLFWSFGFLRMGTTGLVSQANGASDQLEVSAVLIRAIGLGLCLGLILTVFQSGLLRAGITIMNIEGEAADKAMAYGAARFWGAPAELTVYAITGWLLGMNRSRQALTLQIVLNLANVAISFWFVLGLDLGVTGVGLGTSAANAVAMVFGLASLAKTLRIMPEKRILWDVRQLKKMFSVNADIMIRTFALLILFSWFTRSGARLGEEQLAANHVLLQIMAIAAYVLDAFAYVAEARVGAAKGAGNRDAFWRAVRLTGEFAIICGLGLAMLSLVLGETIIALLTNDVATRQLAANYLPYCTAMIALGAAPFLLDGIFIGATQSRDFRNAAIFATLVYVLLDLSLRPFAATGLWIALTASYILRAAPLALRLTSIANQIGSPTLKNH